MSPNVSIIAKRHNYVFLEPVSLKIVFVVLNAKDIILKRASLWSIENLFYNYVKDRD